MSVTSFQVLLEFVNKNHINVSKLTTIADDETTAVESVSRARVCAVRPDVRRGYAPSAHGVRHLLYCVKVFRSASKCLLPNWLYEGLVTLETHASDKKLPWCAAGRSGDQASLSGCVE